MKKLFTVQYSQAQDKFFLTEKDEPVHGVPFDVPIIDTENNTVIELGAVMVDTEIIQASKTNSTKFCKILLTTHLQGINMGFYTIVIHFNRII
jgi:hypothetical protein